MRLAGDSGHVRRGRMLGQAAPPQLIELRCVTGIVRTTAETVAVRQNRRYLTRIMKARVTVTLKAESWTPGQGD